MQARKFGNLADFTEFAPLVSVVRKTILTPLTLQERREVLLKMYIDFAQTP